MKAQPLSPEDYHMMGFDPSVLPDIAAAGPVSASILSKVRDPLVFLLNRERPQSKAMEWGSIVDCLWLTPDLFPEQYVVIPADAPKKPSVTQINAARPSPATVEAIAWWDNFNARAAGKTIIKPEVVAEARKAVSMLNQNDLAMEIHGTSAKQVALVGESPLCPGVKAKCLIDLLPMSGRFQDAVSDLKTTKDPADHPITGIMHAFEYHMKMGYYGMNATAAGFGPRERGIIIWQRSSFPYDVHVREIAPADMALGRQMAVDRMNILLDLDASQLHRHFDTELRIVELKKWQRGDFELETEENPAPVEDVPNEDA